MVKLELMSDNLIIILQELVTNQNLCKYLYYDDSNPLGHADIVNTNELYADHIKPFPFDPKAVSVDMSQLRVYYARGDISDVVVEDLKIYFDIIVAKSLWLIDNKKIRPYVIMSEIGKCFVKKSIDTLGKLRLETFRHLSVNEDFDAIQMVASVEQFTKGS